MQEMHSQRLYAIVKQKIAEWDPIPDEQLTRIAGLLLNARKDA